MKFKHLNVPDSWERYFTKYPQGMSILEALFEWVSQVDSMVDNQNNLNDNVEQFRTEIDAFIGRFDDRLQTEVTTTLQDWQNSGFLDVVISEALQWELDNYIATNEQDKLSINQQLAQIETNVKDFGAKGDGVTDDTQAINLALENTRIGGRVYFPDGVYMIKATGELNTFPAGVADGGIMVTKPVTIELSSNAKLKAITGNKVGYTIVNILNTTDVEIKGGFIEGEKETHIGTTGEFGFGISIKECQRIKITNTHISNCWGDGIYIGYTFPYTISNKDIYINGVISTGNRRQGLSIVNGSHIYIENSEFNETRGTAPQSGIDIEPDGGSPIVTDVFISNCIFNNNETSDIVLGGGNGCKRITISNCFMKNCKSYSVIVTGGGVQQASHIIITDNNIETLTNSNAINVGAVKDVTVSDNTIKGGLDPTLGSGIILSGLENVQAVNNTISNFLYGVLIYTESSKLKILNNKISRVSNGIHFNANSSDFDIKDNHFYNISGNGIYARLTNSSIINNVFKDINNNGIYSSLIDTVIQGNIFKSVGSSTRPIIGLDTPSSSGNLFTNNIFNGVTSQKAIQITGTPEEPHTIANNIANYTNNPWTVPTGTISYHNLIPKTQLKGVYNWTPSAIPSGGSLTSPQITLIGVSLGDHVIITPPGDLNGVTYSGYVRSSNFLVITLNNNTGDAVTPTAGDWKIKVLVD